MPLIAYRTQHLREIIIKQLTGKFRKISTVDTIPTIPMGSSAQQDESKKQAQKLHKEG